MTMEPLLSNLSPQIRSLLNEQQSKTLVLKQGQVMLGRVKEILPNNVALIQFGNHQVTAKLEVPINIHEAYLFEVTSIGEIPQLSVVSQSSTNFSLAEQIQMILANLNIAPTKVNKQFLHEIFSNDIPVRQADLKQALELLKNDQSQETKEIIIHLLKKQLPISETTLQSYKAVQSNRTITEQFNQLYQAVIKEPVTNETTDQLLKSLSQFIDTETVQEPMQPLNQEQFDQLTEWLQHKLISRQIDHESSSQKEVKANQDPNELEIISQVDEKAIANRLERQLALSDKQLFQFEKVLSQINTQGHAVTSRTLSQLQVILEDTIILAKVIQRLPTQAQDGLTRFMNDPSQANLLEFIQPLTDLIEQQIPQENSRQIFNLIAQMNRSEPNLFPTKDQFLIQIKNYLLNAGLDFEAQIYQQDKNTLNQSSSLKQVLLESLAQQPAFGREIEQLLHHLTGQQLSLIHEDPSFIYLSTTIPGLIGEDQDIKLEFYSKKDQNDKIDTDYCRIAFYLELNRLKTTMIDMNVQNRVVHLTVYNDQNITKQLNIYKALLKDGLKKYNYHLSSVSYKPLPDQQADFSIKPELNKANSTSSRWDVRI